MSQRAAISIFFFMLVLVLSDAFILSPAADEPRSCDFPAIIDLGDSNSNTGRYAAGFDPPTPPYGNTCFHMPARRFSDGRLVLDFIGMF
ncbi:hypothetical protein F3Y22_tig00116965pilonHSYRG00583 [Hibiscus syriacus]|uniref:GDSL esterase/lipase n=1 Tax=Hibiscus syriacus TaxID=106335 RepID=A0A6A2WJ39_HIBSY|nr:hypothetical protein F3Y22_tig00116965pilonHSYRG00583 [Hibiscus syriacus]